MKHFFLVLIVSLIVISSCGKKGNTGNNDIAPTDLVVKATVSNDSSGNVSFTAAATNAVSYFYDYGNGIFQTVASGVTSYKYPASGTYTVNVIDLNGCSLTHIDSIYEPPVLSDLISSTTSFCNFSNFTVSHIYFTRSVSINK